MQMETRTLFRPFYSTSGQFRTTRGHLYTYMLLQYRVLRKRCRSTTRPWANFEFCGDSRRRLLVSEPMHSANVRSRHNIQTPGNEVIPSTIVTSPRLAACEHIVHIVTAASSIVLLRNYSQIPSDASSAPQRGGMTSLRSPPPM